MTEFFSILNFLLMKTRRRKKSEFVRELEAQCRSQTDDNADIGVIEVIDNVDDLEFALKNMSPKYLNIQLWHALCGYVGHGICADGRDGDKIEVIYQYCHERFIDVHCNVADHEDLRQRLVSYLPDSQYPPSFSEYVSTKLQGEMKSEFLKKYNTSFEEIVEEDEFKAFHFGYLVWTTFTKTRASIMSLFNVYWTKTNLRLGVKAKALDNKSGLLNAIRCAVYLKRLPQEVRITVNNKWLYGKNTNKEFVEDPDAKRRLFDETLEARVNEGMPSDYFPNEWLCFILFGKPAKGSPFETFCNNLSLNKRGGVSICDLSEVTVGRKKSRSSDQPANDVVPVNSLTTPLSPPISSVSSSTALVREVCNDRYERLLLKDSVDTLFRLKQLTKSSKYDQMLEEELLELHELCLEERKKLKVDKNFTSYI